MYAWNCFNYTKCIFQHPFSKISEVACPRPPAGSVPLAFCQRVGSLSVTWPVFSPTKGGNSTSFWTNLFSSYYKITLSETCIHLLSVIFTTVCSPILCAISWHCRTENVDLFGRKRPNTVSFWSKKIKIIIT